MTISLPQDIAAALEDAVERGDYGSTGEVVRQALHEWALRHLGGAPDLTALKAEIDKGMADLAAGRVREFDLDRIVERGRTSSTRRSPSA
ncbi:ribbon-helix-helix domain-containing protein [Rhodoplanes roseus]|nr:ribbon-helix-helix protein, CopG family [Rhodoplanes roseus]